MNNKLRNIGFIAIKTVIHMLLTVAISAFSRFLFVDNMFEQEYFSEQILNVWFLVFFLLIFNSLTIAINQHDKYFRRRFLENIKNNKFTSHVKFILSSLEFYVDIICISVLSFIFPVSFLYGFVNKVFFYRIESASFKNKLYTLLIILPIMFVLVFVARIMIQKSWYVSAQKEKLNSTKEKKKKMPPVIKSVITVAVIYCGSSMALPWIFPIFVTLWNFGGIMLFVCILLALVVSIIVAILAYYIRAILKRKSFVTKLKKYCTDNSVYISEINKPYLSLFVPQNGFDFTVEKNGKKYDCKFIAGIFPRSPIILSDKGNGLKQDTIRLFRIEIFAFLTRFDFGYESENKKILILLPTPKTFFISKNEFPPRLADIGENAGKYVVYNSTGFLNALERNTL